MVARRDAEGGGRVGYRIVTGSELGDEWVERLGADTLQAENNRTTLEVTVADQAELLGLLGQLHDLNLHLSSVCRIEDKPSQRDL